MRATRAKRIVSPLSETAWMAAAACRGRTEIFYPAPSERVEQRQCREALARTVCGTCPVLLTCRDWARNQREYGFWGGESEEERAAAGYCVDFPIGRVARVWRERRRALALAEHARGTGCPRA